MPIALTAASGGGNVTIQSAAGSITGTKTLVAPAVNGNIITSGDTGTVTGTMLASKTVVAANMANGAIVQVVQSVITSAATTTSQSYSDTGLTASITPSSSSNKILVLVDVNLSSITGAGGIAKLVRNSTDIYVGDASGSRPQALIECDGAGTQYSVQRNIASYLDSPATTSSVTYKIQYLSTVSGSIFAMNRTSQDRNTSLYDIRAASSITLFEVVA